MTKKRKVTAKKRSPKSCPLPGMLTEMCRLQDELCELGAGLVEMRIDDGRIKVALGRREEMSFRSFAALVRWLRARIREWTPTKKEIAAMERAEKAERDAGARARRELDHRERCGNYIEDPVTGRRHYSNT